MATNAAAEALAAHALVNSLNPFAVSHHTDLISSPGGGSEGPDSPARNPSSALRRAFKRSIAVFYGLTSASDNKLFDMLGEERIFSEVTLAHIWPESYKNFSDYANSMGLPEGFELQPRNFLLLPRALHVAFDEGKVGFIPSRSDIVIRVFRIVVIAEFPIHGVGISDPKYVLC